MTDAKKLKERLDLEFGMRSLATISIVRGPDGSYSLCDYRAVTTGLTREEMLDLLNITFAAQDAYIKNQQR